MQTVSATVACYQNNSGYSYYRLLGFKPTCRKYCSFRVDGWECVDAETVRLRISGPVSAAEAAAVQPAAGQAETSADNTFLVLFLTYKKFFLGSS